MTTTEPPLSAPSASSQALPADRDTRCPSRIAATTGAVIRCRFYCGHDGAHGNGLPGEGRAAWVDGDDDVIAISPGVPTGTRDPADRWWTHGSCGPAPGNADGPRWTSCVGCGKPDLQWTPYPAPGNPTNGDSDA